MGYGVHLDRNAEKDLSALPLSARQRILDALDRLEVEPRPPGCRKLVGTSAVAWRVRVGDYRAFYDVDDTLREVTVFGIMDRKDAYRKR